MKVISILFVIIILISFIQSKAQFEQKLTMNAALGLFIPTGASDYLIEGTRDQYMPYFLSNFETGLSFTAGVRYNVNRKPCNAYSLP